MDSDDSAAAMKTEVTDEPLVMSEVHIGCPPATVGPHYSRFTISLPHGIESSRYSELFKDDAIPKVDRIIDVDEDGDLVLPRRRDLSAHSVTMTIQHSIKSSIPKVGLQIWRAELVLSDFVMHKICTSSEFDGIIALELGAGTGLVGILLSRVAQTVFLTDYGDEILDNCAANVTLNSKVFNGGAGIYVRELNWFSSWPFDIDFTDSATRYSWISSDIEDVKRASFIVAADVIYSDDLTDALFSVLERLMSIGSEKVLYLAMEKRYNFSMDDLDVVANGYSHFRSYLIDKEESECLKDVTRPYFIGKRIFLTHIPQFVKSYDRGKDVELWQIRYVRSQSDSCIIYDQN